MRHRFAITACLFACALAAGCGRESAAPPAPAPAPAPPRVKQVFNLNAYERDFGYSQAVLIDKTLYVSGSMAVDREGKLVAPGDMAGQLRAAYQNVRLTLAAHGVSFDEVVRETIYTTDMAALLKVADLRFEYYDKDRLPATSWVEVRRLIDPGFLVEVEVTAELP